MPHLRAHSWRVSVCEGFQHGECIHPHIIFLDKAGQIICDGVIDVDHIDRLTEQLREIASVRPK